MSQKFTPVVDRDLSLRDTDKSALYAIVQAAVNVELFTIPLYMTSLYSLHGTHRINGANDFYQGRMWPGMATSANPKTGNEKAFNAIFSVFIAEMLHLQLASNICKAVGVAPKYTGKPLQNSKFAWTCYGPENTIIPHIIDLKDTIAPYNGIKVSLGPVNKNQVDLFLAIEETEDDAEKIIANPSKYFPPVPFDGWSKDKKSEHLPLFGSIGYMYLCMAEYMAITYTDGTTLWDYVFQPKSLQQDIFNSNEDPHQAEYPQMRATINSEDKDKALLEVINMINGITDQGEGSGVVNEIRKALPLLLKNPAKAEMLNAVQPNFQPKPEALEHDYPSYNDMGVQEEQSHDAAARVHYGAMDHYETFAEVKALLEAGALMTWEQWHAEGNEWTEDMLQTPDHVNNKYPIPAASDIAGALNRLKKNDTEKNFHMLSQVVAGAIKGVTMVLDSYWNGQTKTFPFPSMSGSGDRMSLCWAVFGKAPDLSIGVTPKTPGILYHACQGMNLDANMLENANNCAAMEVFHTCKGSNTCAAEGGCGFVQNVQGGGSCSSGGSGCGTSGSPSSGSASGCGAPKKVAAGNGCGAPAGHSACGSKAAMLKSTAKSGCGHSGAPSGGGKPANGCGAPSSCSTPTPSICGTPAPTGPVYYSAPSDNRCMSYGGCAVPISASQMFPSPDGKSSTGQMELFNFLGTQFQPEPINTMAYNEGDLVYDVAWNAYIAVLQERNRPIPAKPKPSDIRLAFPPST